jgi:hypothetical protein
VRIGNKPPQDPAGDRARWANWRAQRLRSAGFPADVAERLAGEREIDLHELLELVDRGCPPHLATRILAPLEQGSGRS